MQDITTYDAESPFDQLVGARERGERPVAPDADLSGADLSGAHMCLYPDILNELAEKWQGTDGLGVDRG